MTSFEVLARVLCPEGNWQSVESRWSAQQRTHEQCDPQPNLAVWATPEPATRGFPGECGSGEKWTLNDARRFSEADRQRR